MKRIIEELEKRHGGKVIDLHLSSPIELTSEMEEEIAIAVRDAEEGNIFEAFK